MKWFCIQDKTELNILSRIKREAEFELYSYKNIEQRKEKLENTIEDCKKEIDFILSKY